MSDPLIERERAVIARVVRVQKELHLSQTRAALDCLTDPTYAEAYVAARAPAAEALRTSLQWSAPSHNLRIATHNGVSIVRELPGRSIGTTLVWGYVTIGRAHFPVECEDQPLAYLLSRSAAGV